MILPGKTIGILGGGQLGRMFAIAARRMGYHVHAFDPIHYGPTGQIADFEVNSSYTDIAAARDFARLVDVVTFEFENVPAETLAAIEQICPVHPSPRVLDTCRHRLREKRFLNSIGIPTAPFCEINSVSDLEKAIREVGTPSILKSAEFGYDGKGQVTIHAATDLGKAWESVGNAPSVLEGFVNFEKEISVIAARTTSGQVACFDVAENVHKHGILDLATVPAKITDTTRDEAISVARRIAESLDVIGLIAVEMFVVNGRIVVNELAPRPHNSGHFSFDACLTSQFEQQLRAVCGLPLGDTKLFQPVAMANLLGDLWMNGEPHWAAALSDPRVKLHLYGKTEPKRGRKMGHLTALADTVDEAKTAVSKAREAMIR
jgi:5-(carboxyamino)imidazole ribonucleotide synthase